MVLFECSFAFDWFIGKPTADFNLINIGIKIRKPNCTFPRTRNIFETGTRGPHNIESNNILVVM